MDVSLPRLLINAIIPAIFTCGVVWGTIKLTLKNQVEKTMKNQDEIEAIQKEIIELKLEETKLIVKFDEVIRRLGDVESTLAYIARNFRFFEEKERDQ